MVLKLHKYDLYFVINSFLQNNLSFGDKKSTNLSCSQLFHAGHTHILILNVLIYQLLHRCNVSVEKEQIKERCIKYHNIPLLVSIRYYAAWVHQ